MKLLPQRPLHALHAISAIILFFLATAPARAALDNSAIMDNVAARYMAVAQSWQSVIAGHASILFWSLATMSMVWTFGLMLLRKADIGEFFAEFIRFAVSTGFFWWLLSNGPTFAAQIIDSMRDMAATASGLPNTGSPSGLADIGFKIYFSVKDHIAILSPLDSLCAILMGMAILIVLVLVAVNMLILTVSGWILAYAGIFFLGFGGARWTSDMAITYYKSVLSLAAQSMTMVLLVGIGQSFVDQYVSQMSQGLSMPELCIMLVVSIVLLSLVQKVPPLIGALAGGNIHALGHGMGIGSIAGGAAMSVAALATSYSGWNLGRSAALRGSNFLTNLYSPPDNPETAGTMLSHPDIANSDHHPDHQSDRNSSGNPGRSPFDRDTQS